MTNQTQLTGLITEGEPFRFIKNIEKQTIYIKKQCSDIGLQMLRH
jgi:hypothetical protein